MDSTWSYTGTDIGTFKVNIDDLVTSLSGEFTNSNNSLEASVAIVASGIKYACIWDEEWSGSSTVSHIRNGSDDCSLDETAQTYASASINVRMTLDVEGIANDVNLEASIERTGLEDGIASIDLTYGGNQLDFAFNSVDGLEQIEDDATETDTITATLSNHNGVTLTATYINIYDKDIGDDEDTITGVITHEGEEFATVSDEGLVTFSDGTFVSL